MAMSGTASEVPECPESSGIRDHLVVSGEEIQFDYLVGALAFEADRALCSCIAITEIDGAVLCAVPESVWDRTKAKRILPIDCLRKAVKVMVPGAIDDEREIPEQQPTFRLWCGLLKSSYEENFSAEFEAVDYPFPVDSMGIPKIPFARALVHIARDHFEFATADDGRPPPLDMEQRLQSVEQLLADMRVSLARLAPPPPGLTGDGGPRAAPLPPPPADVGKRQAAVPSIPPGIDPGVARQALQSGATPEWWVSKACREGRDPLVEDCHPACCREEVEEGSRTGESFGSGRVWISLTSRWVRGLQPQQVSRPEVIEEAPSSPTRADLPGLGAAHGGGLEPDGRLAGDFLGGHFRPGLAGAPQSSTEFSSTGSGLLDFRRCLGCSATRQNRRGPRSMCLGCRLLRPAGYRQGFMVGGSRNQPGGPSSLLILCNSSPVGELGEPPHKADRRALAGVVSGKVARHPRLSGQ